MRLLEKLKTGAAIAFVVMTAGCSVTGGLARRHSQAQLLHSTKMQRQQHMQDNHPAYVKVERPNGGPAGYLLPTDTLENGERVMQVQLEEVVVVARSRTLPERMGRVDVDFVITLPKAIQGSCRNIIVTPILHNRGERKALDEVSIRGVLFNKVQQRDYWQYNRYLDVFNPDSIRAERAFDRFVRFPYPEDVRLDSVHVGRNDISYFYTQEVPTAEVGKRMTITLEGSVQGLDGSSYIMPPSDTLVYNISSMLNFADTTTRYVVRVIEKYAQIKDRNYLSFQLGKAGIIDTLGNNAGQLSRIKKLMEQLVYQHEYHIDSIILSASASPEGNSTKNLLLASRRAEALSNYLADEFPDAGLDTLITIRPVGEDWTRLGELIKDNPRIRHSGEILKLIAAEHDPERREHLVHQRFKGDYAYMKRTLYPLLRSVDFKYYLRRVGMVRDTVHTTEIDTTYLRGRRLLEERRYTEALRILKSYDDRNTAIALLSLGYDEHAYEILCREPSSAVREYLQAIACARMKRWPAARKHYAEAVRIDPNMEYRADLDPEINRLNK